ncbi:MAG TPA: energy-coupled thiamine transporter ThiT [Bacillales bacterium]|nr:energy-coupled thiamine transporter ThiT [Bacillales bacterium]
MKINKTQLMAEIAIMVALATVLGFIKFEAPWAYGGSISLEMLPIVFMAFRRGVKIGVITGMIYGIVDFLISPFFVHPISILVDYPIAFMLVGFSGIVKPRLDSGKFSQASVIVLGTFIGSGLRFLAHFVSGFVWWGQYAPKGTPVVLYSLVYNAGYMIPSFILTAVVMVLLVVSAPRLVKEKAA